MPGSIALATLCTPEIAPLGFLTDPSKRYYCDLNRYAYIREDRALDPMRPPAWSKIRLLQQWLPLFDWIMWIDADAIIMDPTVSAFSLLNDDADLVISSDHNGINSGIFFLRNSPASHTFLQTVYDQTQYLHHRWWEQAAMMHVLNTNPAILRVHEVERLRMNAYIDEYKDGHFIAHAVGDGNKLAALLPLAKKVAAKYFPHALPHIPPEPKFPPPSMDLIPRSDR